MTRNQVERDLEDVEKALVNTRENNFELPESVSLMKRQDARELKEQMDFYSRVLEWQKTRLVKRL